jgi:hypothetical protein
MTGELLLHERFCGGRIRGLGFLPFSLQWNNWKGLWREGVSDILALAYLVWCGNKMVKREEVSLSLRSSFYVQKERWVGEHQDFLVKGEVLPLEREHRPLYCHCFQIEGECFCFHSRSRPRSVVDEEGERSFGQALSREQSRRMPLPLGVLTDLLRWRLDGLREKRAVLMGGDLLLRPLTFV